MGGAVDISAKSHSVRHKHCSSCLQSAILNFGGRLTSHNVAVGCVTIGLGMVKNIGETVGISVMCHSVVEKHSTSGLPFTVLHFELWRLIEGVHYRMFTIVSGWVENVAVTD